MLSAPNEGWWMEHGPDIRLVAVLAASLIAWGVLSGRLARLEVSAPSFFVALGFVLTSEPISVVEVDLDSENLRTLAEITLALLLFSDAARVSVRKLRHDAGIPLRLLLLGLPLSVAAGTALAVLVFPGLDPWAAAVIAAAVAPTDAALGAQVVEDPHVPDRVQRILSVESGLNDGIATPFVTFFIAGAAADLAADDTALGSGIGDLGVGILAGIVVGLGGGWLLATARKRAWAAAAYQEITVLALALCAYAVSLELSGNGFIAAFVGGLAFGAVPAERDEPAALHLDAQAGTLLSFIVWFLFGTVLVSALDTATWQTVLFAVLALTVGRMLPVAVALIGTHVGGTTTAFVGWFGPRGLATVVFGLIAFDSLTGSTADVVISSIALTVLLSIVAHGVTARPLARRYGASAEADLGRT